MEGAIDPGWEQVMRTELQFYCLPIIYRFKFEMTTPGISFAKVSLIIEWKIAFAKRNLF